MNYLIEPQVNPAGLAAGKCKCNCTVNFGTLKVGSGGCGANCPTLSDCVSPSGAKLSPTSN